MLRLSPCTCCVVSVQCSLFCLAHLPPLSVCFRNLNIRPTAFCIRSLFACSALKGCFLLVWLLLHLHCLCSCQKFSVLVLLLLVVMYYCSSIIPTILYVSCTTKTCSVCQRDRQFTCILSSLRTGGLVLCGALNYTPTVRWRGNC